MPYRKGGGGGGGGGLKSNAIILVIACTIFSICAMFSYLSTTHLYYESLSSPSGASGTGSESAEQSQRIRKLKIAAMEGQQLLRTRAEAAPLRNSTAELLHQVTTMEAQAKTPASRKDLVIGMAKGLLEEQLAIFAASLREHATPEDIDVMIFIDAPVSNRMHQLAEQHAVQFQYFREGNLPHANYHPSTYRWPMINDYLNEHHEVYKRVITADIRDTFFQQNPFPRIFSSASSSNQEEDEEEEALWVFEDDPSKMIGECYWNSGWIKDCFGRQVLAELAERKIYCSGLSAGTMKAMMAYTKTMNDKIQSPDFEKCERNGVDQGMHNVFIHQGKIKHLQRMDQSSGQVANLQAPVGRIRESDFKVLNVQDKEYSVVHQYDRNPSLAKRYLEKYVDWDRSEDGKVCQHYDISHDGDMLQGMCDLKHGGGIDAAMCCKVCDLEKNCQGFAHVGGTCYLKSCTGPVRMPNGREGITMGLRKKR